MTFFDEVGGVITDVDDGIDDVIIDSDDFADRIIIGGEDETDEVVDDLFVVEVGVQDLLEAREKSNSR